MEPTGVYRTELERLTWCPECSTKTMLMTQIFDCETHSYIETVYECKHCGHLI